MMPVQAEIDDYYGYNSIINCEGKRIRRMRRTEASVEKLHNQRLKSSDFSRSISSRRSRISKDSNSNLPVKINKVETTLKFYRQKTPNSQVSKQIKSFHSVSNFNDQKSKNITQYQANNLQSPFKNIKQAFGEYYIGNQSKLKHKSGNIKLKSYRFIQKEKKLTKVKSSELLSDVGCFTSNEQSRRTLKKTEKSYKNIKPFLLQKNGEKISSSHSDYKMEVCLIKKQQVNNIKSTTSKGNSKAASKQSMQQNEKQVINSIHSKKQGVQASNTDSEIISSSEISNKLSNSYNLNQYDSRISKDLQSQKGSVSKKSSINIQISSSKLSQSQSNASKISIRLKESKQKSKLKVKDELVNEVKPQLVVKKLGPLTKKSTETTESNENSYEASKKMNNDNNSIQNASKKASLQLKINNGADLTYENTKNISLFESSSLKSSKLKIKAIKQNIQLKNNKFSINHITQKHLQIYQNPKVKKKKSINSYNFNDVVQNIEEHQIRICSLYLFIDSTRSLYQTPLKFERYERLCFLMLKKYKFEKNRIIESIQGGDSCFTLMDAEIPTEVLMKHSNRQQVRERLISFIEQGKKISKEIDEFYNQISRKYQKDKYIKLEVSRDNFSQQIMRLLMEQLSKLYQQLQNQDIQADVLDKNQQRIIEIVEIMFLISQLSGRFVKKFELFEENQIDFEQYYAQNYERIMETAQYFQKYI